VSPCSLRQTNPGLARILISFLKLFGKVFGLQFVLPSVLSLNNPKLHKTQSGNIFIQEKLITQLTSNPGLALMACQTA